MRVEQKNKRETSDAVKDYFIVVLTDARGRQCGSIEAIIYKPALKHILPEIIEGKFYEIKKAMNVPHNLIQDKFQLNFNLNTELTPVRKPSDIDVKDAPTSCLMFTPRPTKKKLKCLQPLAKHKGEEAAAEQRCQCQAYGPRARCYDTKLHVMALMAIKRDVVENSISAIMCEWKLLFEIYIPEGIKCVF